MSKKLLQSRWSWMAAVILVAALALGWASRESAAGEKTGKGWLGVSVEELTPSLRKKMKLGEQTGLLVTNVAENSPADDAGFREDDVIVEFDGKRVEEAGVFSRMVRETGADKKVTIVLVREGERKSMEVLLDKRRGMSQNYAYGFGSGPGVFAISGGRPRLGVQVQELDENLAAYFKVQPRAGVLILEVHEDSPAEKAGIKSGDVITKVGEEKISDAEGLIETLSEYEEGDKVAIAYVRQGKSAIVEIEIEQADSRSRFWAPRHEGMGFRDMHWKEEDPRVIIRKIDPRVQINDIIHREIETKVRKEVEANLRRALDENRRRREHTL